MTRPIKIFIVEDHAIFLEGLRRVLAEMEGITVVGVASNGQEFLEQVEQLVADVILMDIRMPGVDGISATERALKVRPGLRILVFSMYGEADYLYPMILLGIGGFILKSSSLENLERAIRTVANGEQYFSPELNLVLAHRLKQVTSSDMPLFTRKETEILDHLCRGLSTSEIAGIMSISKRTVEGYRAKLMQKTGMSSTTNLVIYAIRNNLVKVDKLATG